MSPYCTCIGIVSCKDKGISNWLNEYMYVVWCIAAPQNNNVQIRLTGGPTTQEGLLQVNYAGQWGTVCDDDFTDNAAQVVCKSLGLTLLVLLLFPPLHFSIQIKLMLMLYNRHLQDWWSWQILDYIYLLKMKSSELRYNSKIGKYTTC